MKTIAISLVTLIVVSASCKKNAEGGSNNAGAQKLKTYTEDKTMIGGRTVETYNVTYDEQGRFISLESVNRPDYRTVYTYQNNGKFTFEKIEGEKVTLHSTCFLNGNSQIDSSYEFNHRNNDTSSFKYLYNEENKLVRKKEYIHNSLVSYPVLANTTNYQYDINGILTKVQDINGETTYRYDSVHLNTVQLEPSYFPFQERLPTHTYISKFGRTVETENTYLYDDKNRLIQERVAGSDGTITVKTYTYQ